MRNGKKPTRKQKIRLGQGSSRLVHLDFTQEAATASLHLGGTMAAIMTLPIPEAPDGTKWKDTLRIGGSAAILSVLPVPEWI